MALIDDIDTEIIRLREKLEETSDTAGKLENLSGDALADDFGPEEFKEVIQGEYDRLRTKLEEIGSKFKELEELYKNI